MTYHLGQGEVSFHSICVQCLKVYIYFESLKSIGYVFMFQICFNLSVMNMDLTLKHVFAEMSQTKSLAIITKHPVARKIFHSFLVSLIVWSLGPGVIRYTGGFWRRKSDLLVKSSVPISKRWTR